MQNSKRSSLQAFNKQAKTYDNDIKGQHARSLYPEIIRILKNIDYTSILDMGCGTGELLKEISIDNPKAKLFGIDISPNMIEIARTKLKNKADLVIGDTEFLPFDNEAFDIIICNDSFHHYPAPKNVLSEAHRVLKKNGVIIIGDCRQPIIARQVMNLYMKISNEGDVKIYSENEMRNLLVPYFHSIHWEKVQSTACISFAYK